MKRLDGKLSYKATLQRGKNKDFTLKAESDLKGLALDLPVPLGKTVKESLPMRVGWQRYSDGKSMVLNATLGEQVNARFLHRENQKGGSYFYAGAVGVNRSEERRVGKGGVR